MIYHHPFTFLAPSIQKKAFFILTLLTLAVMTALTLLGGPLKTEQAPLGIVSFEFSKTLPQAQQMLDSWGSDGQVYAALNLGLDYVFLVLYPCSIALGGALLSDALKLRQSFLSGAGALLSWLQFGAGASDAVENAALITVLLGSQQPAWPELAWWCAGIKFTIVGIGLGYVMIGAVYMLGITLLRARETTR